MRTLRFCLFCTVAGNWRLTLFCVVVGWHSGMVIPAGAIPINRTHPRAYTAHGYCEIGHSTLRKYSISSASCHSRKRTGLPQHSISAIASLEKTRTNGASGYLCKNFRIPSGTTGLRKLVLHLHRYRNPVFVQDEIHRVFLPGPPELNLHVHLQLFDHRQGHKRLNDRAFG